MKALSSQDESNKLHAESCPLHGEITSDRSGVMSQIGFHRDFQNTRERNSPCRVLMRLARPHPMTLSVFPLSNGIIAFNGLNN